jgi:DNA-binding MarR family transcriptional regulator
MDLHGETDWMTKGNWTVLSNHGRILHYLVSHPKCTFQKMATATDLSIGAVQKIVYSLEGDGYITRTKEGRTNRYFVNMEKHLRHHLEQSHTIGDLMTDLCDPPRSFGQ